MTRSLVALCVLLAVLAAAGHAAPPASTSAPARPFVRVVGTRFMEGDRPFYFVGANLNVMHEPSARARAAATIAAAARDGLRVGRVWALGEGLPDAPAWLRESYLFRAGPRGWQESAFRHLDGVIAEAGKHGMRLIVTLSNSWADYGGIPMYLRWAEQVDVESYGYSDRFFQLAGCRAQFLEHVRRVVGRRSSVTGVRYRDDPTILAWELQNEMNGTPEAAVARERWVREAARAIRALDANHLIVPGLIGYNLQRERRDWIRMCKLPEVAFCDQHIYPEEHLRSRGLANMRRYIDDRVQLAHQVVGKPIVFGEFGFDDRPQRPAAQRERSHRQFLERVFLDGGNGALVWIYQPTLPWRRSYPVLTDSPRHRGLRRVLTAFARRLDGARELRARNPRLGPQIGEAPIAPTHALLTRRDEPHPRWVAVAGDALLELGVERFHRAWFEEAGSWDGGILVHAYGRRSGWFEYRFRGPAFAPARLELRVRMSSEYPGRSAPPHGHSRVRVLLDGRQVAAIRVRPDDGVGEWYGVAIDDRAVLARLHGGLHTLRFQVDEGPEANGIALYGAETRLNREPVEDPGPIQLRARRGGS
jgi:mannan endo-1,4-beta-mannosidase